MQLYIKVENGAAVGHPAFDQNLIAAFGAIPEGWEFFERTHCPEVGVYEILESQEPIYQKVNGVWTDVWNIRPMTLEEKSHKQQEFIKNFQSRPQFENWSAWTFDEQTCKMMPPVPRPEHDEAKSSSGIMVFWCGAENCWKDTPVRPDDGLSYAFDFVAWTWVQEVN